MRIALVSDAWTPQVNGVVRTLTTTVEGLRGLGHEVETVTPDGFATLPCPGYPEIRLALTSGRHVAARLDGFAPEAIHIATEGPLGWAARRWCLGRKRPFTTAFHTRFPDYLAARTRLPAGWFWPPLRHFHAAAARTFVATERLGAELATHRIAPAHRWSRGIDLDLFSTDAPADPALAALPRPILLCVGRVAVEKNIEAFLTADVPGTKLVVGDGPSSAMLRKRHPRACFTGALHGAALAAAYRAADLLVFPSLTDTFGLVMIEALACGLPVAAFPVPGPLDIIGANGRGRRGATIGALDADLATAIRAAASARPADCVAEAQDYRWEACLAQFLDGLAVEAAQRSVSSSTT